MRKASKSGVWKLCSEYNRRKEVDDQGYGSCCSCDIVIHWKEGDAGHFIPRTKGKAIFWRDDNIHLQCKRCNGFDKEYAHINYTLFMQKKYGNKKIEELKKASREIYRERQSDLEYWRDFYLKKLEELNNGN